MVGGTWFQEQQGSTNPAAAYQQALRESADYLTCIMNTLIGGVEVYGEKLMDKKQVDAFNDKIEGFRTNLEDSCTSYNCACRRLDPPCNQTPHP